MLMLFFQEGAQVFLDDGADGVAIPLEALVQAVIILSIGILIIVTNVIIIATFITAPGEEEFFNIFSKPTRSIYK